MFLLLTLNIFHTFSNVSIVLLEQVNVNPRHPNDLYENKEKSTFIKRQKKQSTKSLFKISWNCLEFYKQNFLKPEIFFNFLSEEELSSPQKNHFYQNGGSLLLFAGNMFTLVDRIQQRFQKIQCNVFSTKKLEKI